MPSNIETRYLELLPQRHRDQWQLEYDRAKASGYSEPEANIHAWHSIGVARVPDAKGNFVPVGAPEPSSGAS